MANYIESKAEVEERREIVDVLDIRGLKPREILKQVAGKYANYPDPADALHHDLQTVRARREKLIFAGRTNHALGEFIGQCIEIYRHCIAEKRYEMALEVILKIAKARGIDLNSPQVSILNLINNQASMGGALKSLSKEEARGQIDRVLGAIESRAGDNPVLRGDGGREQGRLESALACVGDKTEPAEDVSKAAPATD